MKVTLVGPAEKRCPYRDEADVGEVEITFDVPEGDAPEFHTLAKQLASFADLALSHEAYTRRVLTLTGALTVKSRWTTAGMAVTCSIDVWDVDEAR